MEKINAYLAKKYIGAVGKNRVLSEIQEMKITYTFHIITGEAEKLILLFLIFGFLHRMKELVVILAVLMLTKHFTGGFHLKTVLSCFLVTFGMIITVIFLGGSLVLPSGIRTFLYVANILCILLFAPVVSDNRLAPTAREAWLVKGKGMTAAILIWLAGSMISGYLEQCILWTLMITGIELIGAKVFYFIRRKQK